MFVVVFYHKTKTLHGGALIHPPPSKDISSTGTRTVTKANEKTGLDGFLAEIGHQNYLISLVNIVPGHRELRYPLKQLPHPTPTPSKTLGLTKQNKKLNPLFTCVISPLPYILWSI